MMHDLLGGNGIAGITRQALNWLLPGAGIGESLLPRDAGSSQKDKALKENTDAIINHTRTMKDGIDQQGGIPGAGRRLRTMPGGWGFQQFENALKGQDMTLGAFNV